MQIKDWLRLILNRRSQFRFLDNNQKARFIAAGVTVFAATNGSLQLTLYFNILNTWAAAMMSQVINLLLGYWIYTLFVFRRKGLLSVSQLTKYLMLSIAIWLLNWQGISTLSGHGTNSNIAALIMAAPLSIASYVTQKKWIYSRKP